MFVLKFTASMEARVVKGEKKKQQKVFFLLCCCLVEKKVFLDGNMINLTCACERRGAKKKYKMNSAIKKYFLCTGDLLLQ